MVLRARVVEMQLACGFGGFAEADLVGHHHAIACIGQRLDDRRPITCRKIAAVQQHHDAAIRLRRRHVHIGHPQLLALVDERQQADRVGIGITFKADAVGFALLGGMGGHQRQGEEEGRSEVAEGKYGSIDYSGHNFVRY